MNFPKQVKTRSVVILLSCLLVLSSVSMYYAFSASTPTSGLTDIYIEPPMMESSYVIGIYTAPSTCYLKNGTSGQIATTGTFAVCLNTAITALTTGGKIFIRSGDYNLTVPVVVPIYIVSNGIWIEGEDQCSTIIHEGVGAGYPMLYYGLSSWHYLGGIKNIWFQGRNVVGSYGIKVNGYASDLTFEDCLFTNFETAMFISAYGSGVEQAKVWNIWIHRCLFEDNLKYGIWFTAANDATLRSIDRIKISECHFYNNLNSLYSNAEFVWHVTFTDNTVQAERGSCINVSNGGSGRQWIITDNHIFDCGIGANGTMAAIFVNGTATFYPDSWLIENNIIANHFTSAPVALNNSVWLTGTVRNFAIQNNFFYVPNGPVRLDGLTMTTDPKLVIQNNAGNSSWSDSNNFDALIGTDGVLYYYVNTTSNTLVEVGSNATKIINNAIVLFSNIFIKAGTYTLNGSIQIANNKSLKFVGAGIDKTILNAGSAVNAKVIEITDSGSYPYWAKWVDIEDMTLNALNGYGIYCDFASIASYSTVVPWFTLKNLNLGTHYANGVKYGIKINCPYEMQVENVRIYINAATTNAIGVWFIQTTPGFHCGNSYFDGLFIQSDDTTYSSIGILMNCGDAINSNINFMDFYRLDIVGNFAYGIYYEATDDTKGNIWNHHYYGSNFEVYGTGVYFTGRTAWGSPYGRINEILFSGCYITGITAVNLTGWSVENIVFQNGVVSGSTYDIDTSTSSHNYFPTVMRDIQLSNPVKLNLGSTVHFEECGYYVVHNYGSTNTCINGTAIAHGLSGTPTAVVLTMWGQNFINSTCWYLPPTVYSANATYVVLCFTIFNAGTITAVAAPDSRTVSWIVDYQP